jgi:hypothetical protein
LLGRSFTGERSGGGTSEHWSGGAYGNATAIYQGTTLVVDEVDNAADEHNQSVAWNVSWNSDAPDSPGAMLPVDSGDGAVSSSSSATQSTNWAGDVGRERSHGGSTTRRKRTALGTNGHYTTSESMSRTAAYAYEDDSTASQTVTKSGSNTESASSTSGSGQGSATANSDDRQKRRDVIAETGSYVMTKSRVSVGNNSPSWTFSASGTGAVHDLRSETQSQTRSDSAQDSWNKTVSGTVTSYSGAATRSESHTLLASRTIEAPYSASWTQEGAASPVGGPQTTDGVWDETASNTSSSSAVMTVNGTATTSTAAAGNRDVTWGDEGGRTATHEQHPWTAPASTAYSAYDPVDPAGQRTPPFGEGEGTFGQWMGDTGNHLANGSSLLISAMPAGLQGLKIFPLQAFGMLGGYVVGSNLTDPNGVYGTSPIDSMEQRASQVKESGNREEDRADDDGGKILDDQSSAVGRGQRAATARLWRSSARSVGGVKRPVARSSPRTQRNFVPTRSSLRSRTKSTASWSGVR